MKVEIKHNLIIFDEPREWESISFEIVREYGASMLISWKCRRELGFSVRRHKGLKPFNGDEETNFLTGRFYYSEQIHLDFFNEAAQSWFVLKYIKTNG